MYSPFYQKRGGGGKKSGQMLSNLLLSNNFMEVERRNPNLWSNRISPRVVFMDAINNFFSYIPTPVSFKDTTNHHNRKRTISICNQISFSSKNG